MKNIINMPTPARERFLRMLDLLRSHPRKKLREQKYSYSFSLSRSKVDCMVINWNVSVSLLLDIYRRLGVSGLHTVRTFIELTCQKKLLITI